MEDSQKQVKNEQLAKTSTQPKKPFVDKSNASKKRLLTNIFMLFVAVAAGFVGGHYGAKSDLSSDSKNVTVQREVLAGTSELIGQIAKDVGPSVVSINVTSSSGASDFYGFGQNLEQQSAGTGFILNKEGYIITNRHVVDSNTKSVSITMSDGKEVNDVEVVGRTNNSDPLDIAFLKIKDTSGLNIVPAKLGDSSKVEVGDSVVAIGNALGQFQNTVTSGIISGFGRDIQAGDQNGNNVESLQNLFQTDAAINAGNSGGPLVNSASEVIGINVASAGVDNISFAIPINDANALISTVLKKGKLERPYLGVRYVMLTDDIAYNLGVKNTTGAYVLKGSASNPSVISGSPADKAGIKPGDIILSIDGTTLDKKNSVISVLGKKEVGQRVNLKVLRDGKEINLDVTIEAAPNQ